MPARKEEVIAFKVDRQLAGRMKGIRNRSAFIRDAVLAALENSCPLCGGSGVLTANQAGHWKEFLSEHHIEVLPDSGEVRLVCDASEKA